MFIAKCAHKYFDKVFKTYDKLNNVVSENVRGMRVVKSYVTENKEISKFKKVSNDIENMKFNTAISAIMILVNEIYKFEKLSTNEYKTIAKAVATDSISVAVDPVKAVSDSITVATDSLTDSINSVVESVEVKEEKK